MQQSRFEKLLVVCAALTLIGAFLAVGVRLAGISSQAREAKSGTKAPMSPEMVSLGDNLAFSQDDIL